MRGMRIGAMVAAVLSIVLIGVSLVWFHVRGAGSRPEGAESKRAQGEVIAGPQGENAVTAEPPPTEEENEAGAAGDSVEGRVVLEADGAPVPGARVILESCGMPDQAGKRMERTSDEEGRFRISGVTAGYWQIKVEQAGLAYCGQPGNVHVKADGSVSGLELKLVPEAVIAGRVLEEGSGSGLAGVEVAATLYGRAPFGPAWAVSKSGNSGAFRLTGLRPGEYVLDVAELGPYASEKGVRLPWLGPGQEISDVEIAVHRCRFVRGTTVTVERRPVGEVTVGAWIRSGNAHEFPETKSAEAGHFEMWTACAEGASVILCACKENLLGELTEELLLGPEGAGPITLVLAPGARISGTVVDEEGQAVEKASVALQRSDGQEIHMRPEARTNAEGTFELGPLPEGKYQVYACLEGQRAEKPQVEVMLAPGQYVSHLRLVCKRRPGLAISGRVVDRAGNPVAEAQIVLKPVRLSAEPWNGCEYARSSEDGNYEAPGLVEGSYRLRASHPDHGESEAVVAEAGSEEVELRFAQGLGTIEGRVLSAESGEPVKVFSVSVRNEPAPLDEGDLYVDAWGSDLWPRSSADRHEEGLFRREKMRPWPCPCTVRVEAPGYAPQDQLVRVKPAEEGPTEVIFRLEKGASVQGIVRTDGGRPVSGAQIHLGREQDHGHRPNTARACLATTKADGTFLLDSLAEGRQIISAAKPGFSEGWVEVEVGRGAPARPEIVIVPLGTVAVTVRYGHERVDEFIAQARGVGSGVEERPVEGVARLTVPAGSTLIEVRVLMERGGVGKWHLLSRQVNVVAGQTVQAEFRAGPNTAALEGKVSIGGGPPLRGHLLITLGNEGEAIQQGCNPDPETGNYSFSGLPAGSGALRVSATLDGDTYLKRLLSLNLKEGACQRCDVAFAGGGTVAGEVAGGQGCMVLLVPGRMSLAGMSHEALSESPPDHVAYHRSRHGLFRFEHVDPGTYTVVAHRYDWGVAGKVVEVKEGAEVQVLLGQ